MFEPSNLPNPLGDSEGGGGDQIVAFVTPEVVPVRLIYSSPIPVLVTNFPGQPPPVPGGLRPPPALPPLPTKPGPKAESGVGLETFGLGGLVKLGTVAGAAAAGVRLVTEGFKSLKETFIDPVLGAAKSGFDKGVERGAGTEVLGRSFEVLGTTVGVMLLPATMKLAAASFVVAENFERVAANPFLRGLMTGTAGLPEGGGKEEEEPPGFFGAVKNSLLGGLSRAGHDIRQGVFGGAAGGAGAGKDVAGLAGTDKQWKESMGKVVRLMEESFGAKGQMIGVADIRAQAQQAALQDPIEIEIKKLQIEALKKFIDETAGHVRDAADNTRPPGGGDHA